MLKLTQLQQREEIKLIELHIGKLTDLEVVELQKQQIARILYFAKKALNYENKNRIQQTEPMDGYEYQRQD